jgi:hypothetical protein
VKRIFLSCLLALLLVPAAANAVFPVGDRPDGVNAENGPAPTVSHPASSPQIVREVRTITTHDGSQTLTVVLAALALSVALSATGYVALRVRPMLRS